MNINKIKMKKEIPEVKLKDVIILGNVDDHPIRQAVVCNLYEDVDEIFKKSNQIEVVFNKSKPSNSRAEFIEGAWKLSGGAAGYADNYSRLSEYVAILKKL